MLSQLSEVIPHTKIITSETLPKPLSVVPCIIENDNENDNDNDTDNDNDNDKDKDKDKDNNKNKDVKTWAQVYQLQEVG